MKQKINTSFLKISLYSVTIFSFASLPAFSQGIQKIKTDTSATGTIVPLAGEKEEPELAHPFFTHMGMPDAVGNYSLRVPTTLTKENATVVDGTKVDGKTQANFGFHFETGLSKTIGLHIRNDRVSSNSFTEVMFQFVAIRSKDGMSGFSPIIEFEFPTHKGASGINTLVGFTTAFVRPNFSWNQVLHYGSKENNYEGSAAVVYRVANGVFLVVEIMGEKFPSESIALNMLGGVKVSVGKFLTLGIGYRQPITSNKEFSLQYVFSPDVEW